MLLRFHPDKGRQRACTVKPVASVFAWSSLDARWKLNCHQPVNFVKPGTRQVSYLTLSFSHKEFEEKTGEITEKTVAKEPRGVSCAVKGSNLRNGELGHDLTWLSNFNIVQDWKHGTPKYEACKINFPFHPFPISKVWFWGPIWSSRHA